MEKVRFRLMREVGALLEDTSRKGCGVRTPEKCHAGSRYVGRLETHAYLRQLASGDPPWRHPVCVLEHTIRKKQIVKKYQVLTLALAIKIDALEPLEIFRGYTLPSSYPPLMGAQSGARNLRKIETFSEF